MAMTTATKVGNYLTESGFDTTTTPTSTVIGDLITIVDRAIVEDISYLVLHEEMTGFVPQWSRNADGDWGECNGSNTIFFAKNLPIADTNDDQSVTTSDITVDMYDYSADDWSEAQTVSTVDDKYGKITLSSAPADDDRVFVDYRYYVAGEIPSTTLLEYAANNAVASLVFQNPESDIVQLVESYSVSGLSISKGGQAMLTGKMMDNYGKIYTLTIRQINGLVASSS